MASNEFLVAPSILSADFSKLGQEIKSIASDGADWVHIDVMDGHFVPNLTIGAPVVKSLRATTTLPLDVHLMIDEPGQYIDDFLKAGADYITIHVESEGDTLDCLEQIKQGGAKAGLTARPATPLADLKPFLKHLDLVLVMTVEPGFGGQSFMQDQVKKIDELAKLKNEKNYKYLIEVDGGVNNITALQCQSADILVAGSYVFKNNYKQAIQNLKKAKTK